MLRIDACHSAQDAFNEIDLIIKCQDEIKNIISRIYLSKASRQSDVKNKLVEVYDCLKKNPELYKVVNSSFGAGSVFDEWVNTLAVDKQVNFRVRIEPPVEDEFTIAKYRYKTISNWLKKQEKMGDTHQIRVARAVEAFIQSEQTSIREASCSRVILADFLSDSRISAADKMVINTYLSLLAMQRNAYTELHLEKLFLPLDQSPEDLSIKLSDKFQSQEYEKYQSTLDELFPSIMQVIGLGDKYPHISSSRMDDLVTYIQASSKRTRAQHQALSELHDAGLKTDDPIQSALTTAAKRFAVFAALTHVDECLGAYPIGSVRRKNAAIQGIAGVESLAIMSNLPEIGAGVEREIYRSTYLANLLIEAFPNVFYKPKGDIFNIRSRGLYPITDYVCEALGLKKGINEKIGVLDAREFDVALLDKLYKDREYTSIGNDQNPLWPLLKMIKPIDETFTLLSKIEAYRDVIQLILNGTLTFNDTTAVAAAHVLTVQLHEIILRRSTSKPDDLTKDVIESLKAIEPSFTSSFITRVYRNISSSFVPEQAINNTSPMQLKKMLIELQNIVKKNEQGSAAAFPPSNKPPKTDKPLKPPIKPPRPDKMARSKEVSTCYKASLQERVIHSVDKEANQVDKESGAGSGYKNE